MASGLATNILRSIEKSYAKQVASRSERGAFLNELKDAYERQGLTEDKATNKAHFELSKIEDKENILQKTNTKQGKNRGEFVSENNRGGNETLSLEMKDQKGKFVSMKTASDERSTLRSSANRERLRRAGEAMYEGGIRRAAREDAIAAGTVAAGVGASLYAEDTDNNDEKSKNLNKGYRAGLEHGKSKGDDERVNKKDYPTYEPDTKSASAFREKFSNAKKEGKDTFSFEGREYNTKEKLAKGGVVKKEHKGNRTSHSMQYNSVDMGKFMKKPK
jgi:hypothetical protein